MNTKLREQGHTDNFFVVFTVVLGRFDYKEF